MGTTPSKPNVDPKFLYPAALQGKCEWPPNALKAIIFANKLAPFYPGTEEKTDDSEECPICFLYFTKGLNVAECCHKRLCSECFVQVKKSPIRNATCPFCNNPRFSVAFNGPLTKAERDAEAQEEQRVVEARLKAAQDDQRDANNRQAARLSLPPASAPLPTPQPQHRQTLAGGVQPSSSVPNPSVRPVTPIAPAATSAARPASSLAGPGAAAPPLSASATLRVPTPVPVAASPSAPVSNAGSRTASNPPSSASSASSRADTPASSGSSISLLPATPAAYTASSAAPPPYPGHQGAAPPPYATPAGALPKGPPPPYMLPSPLGSSGSHPPVPQPPYAVPVYPHLSPHQPLSPQQLPPYVQLMPASFYQAPMSGSPLPPAPAGAIPVYPTASLSPPIVPPSGPQHPSPAVPSPVVSSPASTPSPMSPPAAVTPMVPPVQRRPSLAPSIPTLGSKLSTSQTVRPAGSDAEDPELAEAIRRSLLESKPIAPVVLSLTPVPVVASGSAAATCPAPSTGPSHSQGSRTLAADATGHSSVIRGRRRSGSSDSSRSASSSSSASRIRFPGALEEEDPDLAEAIRLSLLESQSH